MTAPDQCCINVKKLLSIRRRPHMTQPSHPSINFAVMHIAASYNDVVGCEPRAEGAHETARVQPCNRLKQLI